MEYSPFELRLIALGQPLSSVSLPVQPTHIHKVTPTSPMFKNGPENTLDHDNCSDSPTVGTALPSVAAEPAEQYVRLRSSDGSLFVIPRSVAEVSSMLRGLMAGTFLERNAIITLGPTKS